ncbi:MAG TPA: right-handed parallel beta-helix repeat-containing protein [Actinomycetota bacterium]
MRRIALLAIAMTITAPGARAHLGSHEIAVRDGYYDPQEMRIDAGETVTWNALAQGHTITADDGRFDFPGDRLTRQGDQHQWTFPTDETFFFHCKVHGTMFGIVVVGAGSPPKQPTDDPPEIRSVPDQYPTIAAAVDGASSGTIVELAPRSYAEYVRIDVPGLVLRGMGASPSDTMIEGGSVRGVGLTVEAPGVLIERLTVRRTTFAGIFVNGAERVTVSDVVLESNDQYGIRMVGVRGGVIRRVHATRSARAGVSIASCLVCDVVVEDALLELNMAGVAITDASNVVVRRSLIRRNGTGIAIRSLITGDQAPQRGAHIHGNTIEDNTYFPVTPPALSAELEVTTGTGIWLSGAQHVLIASNAVHGHLYDIAVADLTVLPSLAVRVVANEVGDGTAADLAWDGIGAAVCFSDNARADGTPATSEPPALQITAGCGPLPAAGIPYPIIAARMLAFSR